MTEIDRVEGWFCETVLWNARDELDPPYPGFKMFASSGPDENIEHLLQDGYKPQDIVIVTYGDHETVWIWAGVEAHFRPKS